MKTPELERSLGFWQSTSFVVGALIGTGIFLKLAKMSVILPSVPWLMAVWVIAGILSFTGALTYAELSTYVSKTGGEFAIIHEAYGKFLAFFCGWSKFSIAVPGSIAAFAVASSKFLSAIFPIKEYQYGTQIVSVSLIILLTGINCLKVKYGARFNLLITSLKVFAIVFLILGIWFVGSQDNVSFSLSQIFSSDTNPPMNLSTMEFIKAFGIAMIAALWAYDGWNGLPKIAGEVKDPQKNIPRAIGVGLFLVMCLYLLINLSYFHILSLGEIQNAYSQLHPESLPVATLAAQKFLSSWGVPFISLVFVVSALGGMNGSIIMGSRVPYAMAAYGLLPKKLAYVEQNMHTPVWSLIIQGTIALFLALSGTFDQLTEYVVVINWIFYVITASTIFYFRKNKYQSSYKSPLFPVLPIVFILSSFFIIINSLLENPNHFFKGLIFMCLGLPVYYYYSREQAQQN